MIINIVDDANKFRVTLEKFIITFLKALYYSKDDVW
jgi:hypothetical protein